MTYQPTTMARRFVALSLCIVLLASFGAVAQDSAPTNIPDLTTPRATIRTFFEAMSAVKGGNDARLTEALACLFVGEDIPDADRINQGTTVAHRLFDVLDQMQFSLELIPESPESDTLEVDLGGDDKQIPLKLHRYEDGNWRINSETLQEEQLAKLEEEVVPDTPEEDVAEGPLFEEQFKSVRATMETFIRGMNETDGLTVADAIRALDLSDVGASVQEDVGFDKAVQLKYVLDRIKPIEYTALSPKSERPRFVFHTGPKGRIVLEAITEPEGDARAWKFTKSTLESLEELYYEYRDRPVAAGITNTDVKLPLARRLRDWMYDNFPFLLNEPFYLQNWQWLGLFAIIFMGLAVSRALSIFLIYLIRGWFNKKRYHLDEKLEQDFLKPIRITFMAWIWWTALSVLGLPADALDLLRTAAIVVTAIGAVWAFYRLIDILDKYLSERAANTHNRYDDLLIPIVTKTLKIFVAAIALVAVAEYKDWEYNNVLAGLGLGGLAFALAAKDVVANIFGSITILLDRPFEIGDWVTIGGVDGNVESVGIRSTRIRTFYNSLISVPNAELTNATVDNWGKRRYRRIKTTLGLAYDTPPEKIEAFCEGVRELIRQHPYTRKDYFHVYLNEFSASSLDILLYCFVETPEWSTELRERHRLFVDVTRLAQRLQVEFAFPTQTVHLRQDETEGTPMPLPHADALEHGQSQARAIVGEFLGGPGVIPPPVSFDVAGGTKRAPLDNPEGEEGQSEGES